MARYAVIVGVEEFEHFSPTRFAHADADLLKGTLVEYCDYLPQHVSLIALSLSADRSPDEVLYEIEQATAGSREGDTVLFYYAGHGHLEGNEPFLLLPRSNVADLERTALPLRDVSARLRRPGRTCIRLLDACHSGIDVRSGDLAARSDGFLEALDQGFDADGWVTVAACGPHEKSYPDGTLAHGIFTYYVCEYIRHLRANVDVVPELLKLDIVTKVTDHAKRNGYTQTPSLIASLRGNITMARRREPPPAPVGPSPSLEDRIATLDAIPQFTNERLTQLLTALSNATQQSLTDRAPFGQEVTAGKAIQAWDVPKGMRQPLVEFAQSRGYRSRHELKRYEYEEEDPFATLAIYMHRKRKVVEFVISQNSDLPNSMVVIDMAAKGTCVPALQVLVYVMPLQLRACLLISAFYLGWPPDTGHHTIKHYYTDIDADVSDGRVREHAQWAVGELVPELQKVVAARASVLEKELKRQ